ncbi:Fatty acyl-CoA reductase 1 [Melipona quadrifasciata]|uniref:Fatty acyl-CoA reductase n=1 Tax=Melipona quadrifasciata TaxID=166423 RepID=A0A0M9A406_9HYME|nr:Fatty acyl-CoA reductase 1 [Melipona quadrifasciata]
MGEVQEARRLTEEESNCKSQIRKFYAGKHILLTGCTGYLGTIILEKLLRTCTEISKVYILVREKANMAIEDRMKKLFENEFTLERNYLPAKYLIEHFLKKNDMIKHTKTHVTKSLSCEQCGELFVKEKDILKHIDLHEQNPIIQKHVEVQQEMESYNVDIACSEFE